VSDSTPRSPEAAAAPPKVDPETLVLRAAPRPVVRFRRGLIIGLASLVSASLVAVTWLALEPPSFQLATGQDGGEPLRRSSPEALANAPATYGDVPRLGPPLPGDLGRPILEHHRELEARDAERDPMAGEADRLRSAAEAERQRLLAARDAARTSAVVVRLGSGSAPTSAAYGASTEAKEEGRQSEPLESPGVRQKSGAASPGSPGAGSPRPALGLSQRTLNAGTIIPASLVTGLNSDLPGMVVAQVTENVRDSATGRSVLIPQGARLIGSYDSAVAYGQGRAMLVWQRIVLPDGSSISLDNMPGTDPAGYAGVQDRVDFNTWRLLKGIALSTLLGVGTEAGLASGESDLVRAVREASQQNAARAGDQITRRNLEVQPTLRVRPGWPVRAIVHKDIVLRPWEP
jgi:type IV secretion system protein VirB10